MRSGLRLFPLDLNFARLGEDAELIVPSAATDWRLIDPDYFFEWQEARGANLMSCQAWTFSGYALFDSELGPRAVGNAGSLLPRVFERARAKGRPITSYVCVGVDLAVCETRPHWVVEGSHGVEIFGDVYTHGFLAPESPWTDLLCERLEEFLGPFPVDWLLCDWFCYGSLLSDQPLPRTPEVRAGFEEIVGRPFPEAPDAPTAEETLRYKREALARQFRRIRDTVGSVSPETKLFFNVPYFVPADPLWVDHPMLLESGGLFAESSEPEIVDWLLSIRRPDQRVFTTVHGRPAGVVDGELRRWCDPETAADWWERGCELVAWAFPVPPRAQLPAAEADAVDAVTAAFRKLAASD